MPPMPAVRPIPGVTPPRQARYQPLVVVLAAVAAGIVADRYGPLPLAAWWLGALGAWAAWWILWRCGRLRIAAVAVLLAAAATAASWHHARWYLFPADDLGQFARDASQPICVEVTALSTPRVVPPADAGPMTFAKSNDQVRMEVELSAVRDGADWRPASGRARLSVDGLLPGIEAGDRLRVFGHLTAPSPPRNPGEFDAAGHLRGDRVRGQLRAAYSESVTQLVAGGWWDARRWLERIRGGGNRLLAKYVGPAHSAIAAAVLLGAREQLDPGSHRDLRRDRHRPPAGHFAGVCPTWVTLAGAVPFSPGVLPYAARNRLRRVRIAVMIRVIRTEAHFLFYMLLVDAHGGRCSAPVWWWPVMCSVYKVTGRRPLRANYSVDEQQLHMVVLAAIPARSQRYCNPDESGEGRSSRFCAWFRRCWSLLHECEVPPDYAADSGAREQIRLLYRATTVDPFGRVPRSIRSATGCAIVPAIRLRPSNRDDAAGDGPLPYFRTGRRAGQIRCCGMPMAGALLSGFVTSPLGGAPRRWPDLPAPACATAAGARRGDGGAGTGPARPRRPLPAAAAGRRPPVGWTTSPAASASGGLSASAAPPPSGTSNLQGNGSSRSRTCRHT